MKEVLGCLIVCRDEIVSGFGSGLDLSCWLQSPELAVVSRFCMMVMAAALCIGDAGSSTL